MNGNPLISVIVPVYNVEPYLRKCVNSILAQSYSNFEIILVNDGSTDNCPQICNEYTLQNSKIRVIHKKNGGVSDARNVGLLEAKGDFISFIDPDDYVDPLFLEQLYQGISNTKSDICVGLFTVVGNEHVHEDFHPLVAAHLIGISDLLERCSSLDMYTSMVTNALWNKLYRRSIFTNISFPLGKVFEDVAISHQLLSKAKSIAFVPAKRYYYCLRIDSIVDSQRLFSAKYYDYIQALNRAIQWQNKIGSNAKYFYPPLVMAEIYAWWGTKYILNDEKKAQNLLKKCRDDSRKLVVSAYFPLFLKISLKIFSAAPWLYSFYRKVLPGTFGGR